MNTALLQNSPISQKNEQESHNFAISLALRFAEILKLLQNKKSSLYSDKEVDYAHSLFRDLDQIVAFIRNKSRTGELIEFFRCFETLKILDTKGLMYFIEQLRAQEDQEHFDAGTFELGTKKLGDVELLRGLFTAFGIVRTQSVAGKLLSASNPILDRYHTYKEGIPLRLFIDDSRIQEFSPETEDDVHLFGSLIGELEGGEITELPVDEVTRDVEMRVIETLSEGELPKMSQYQRGAQRRREKGKIKKIDLAREKQIREETEQFEATFERFSHLGNYIDAQMGELRRFLISHIPYIREAIESFELQGKIAEITSEIHARKQPNGSLGKGFSKREKCETQIRQTQKEIEQWMSSIARGEAVLDIERMKHPREEGVIRKIEGSISVDKRKLQKAKNRLKSLMVTYQSLSEKKERTYENSTTDEGDEKTRALLESTLGELQKKQERSRLKTPPTKEEFRFGIYASLFAEELYQPNHVAQSEAIDTSWIEGNILQILAEMIERYIHIDGVTLSKILDRRREISLLNNTYHPEMVFPEEDISQEKIRKLVATLVTPGFMPEHVLEEIPHFHTPSGVLGEKQKTPRVRKRKTHKEARAIQQAIGKTKTKAKIEKEQELKRLEGELIQFRAYWIGRKTELIKRRFKTLSEIERVKHKLPLSGKNKGETEETLQIRLGSLEEQIRKIAEHLNNPSLIDNDQNFQDLQERITRLRK